MGYNVRCLSSSLKISEDKFDRAIRLLTAYKEDDFWEWKEFDPSTAMTVAEEDKVPYLKNLLGLYGIGSIYDNGVLGMWHNADKLTFYTEDALQFLAPVIDNGSLIAFRGEDGCVFRYRYDSGLMIKETYEPTRSIDLHGDCGWS